MPDTSNKPQQFIIGRVGDISLQDDTVSRQHARLDVCDNNLLLYDLNSRNGTFEIRGDDIIPFESGEIYIDQVFAFGIVLISVEQLLAAIGVTGQWRKKPAHSTPAQLFGTTVGGHGARARDTPGDLRTTRIRARIASRLAEIRSGGAICERTGLAESACELCIEQPDINCAGRARSVAKLADENSSLRQLVLELSRELDAAKRVAELSLKRIELQDALISHTQTVELDATDGSGLGSLRHDEQRNDKYSKPGAD